MEYRFVVDVVLSRVKVYAVYVLNKWVIVGFNVPFQKLYVISEKINRGKRWIIYGSFFSANKQFDRRKLNWNQGWANYRLSRYSTLALHLDYGYITENTLVLSFHPPDFTDSGCSFIFSSTSFFIHMF